MSQGHGILVIYFAVTKSRGTKIVESKTIIKPFLYFSIISIFIKGDKITIKRRQTEKVINSFLNPE